MMKYTLFIMLLAIATPIFPQEVVNDTLQELPKIGIKADRRAQLERAISKLWELDREDQRGTFKFVDYLPMYVMPFRFTDKPTEQPISFEPRPPYTRMARLPARRVKISSELKS